MTADRDLDRLLDAWLAPGPAIVSEDVLDAALERVGRTRQRRALPGLTRLGIIPRWMTIAALAAILVAAVALAGAVGRLSGPGIGGPAPFRLDLAVANFTFDPADAYVPSGVPIQVRLTSLDAGVPHALEVTDANGRVVFVDRDARVGSWSWSLPALPAGRYTLADPVHPSTAGTLHVGEVAPPATRSTAPTPDDSAAGSVAIIVDATGFVPSTITMPAGQRFFIRLRNEDAGARHGIALYDAAGNVVMAAGSADPAGTFTYPIDAMPAGTYPFRDPGHPALTGTLFLVGGG